MIYIVLLCIINHFKSITKNNEHNNYFNLNVVLFRIKYFNKNDKPQYISTHKAPNSKYIWDPYPCSIIML